MPKMFTKNLTMKITHPKTKAVLENDYPFSYTYPGLPENTPDANFGVLVSWMGSREAIFAACREAVKREQYTNARNKALAEHGVIGGSSPDDEEAGY